MQRPLVFLLCLLIVAPSSTPTAPPSANFPGSVAIPAGHTLIRALLTQQSGPIRQPDTPVTTPGGWPQQGTKRTVDVTQLKSEAQELATLAQALQEQIDKIGNGQYPKDLIENLKTIEKISKRIRGEVSLVWPG